MNPEEKVVLQRSLKLSEDNNRILKKLERKARWYTVWGFVKVALIILPLVAGYFFLQPFFEQISATYTSIMEIFRQ